jgi:hypothetical protein
VSFAAQMKEAIEAYADDLLATSPLVPVIANGGLTPRAMALYLESLRYLFVHSEANIKHAADVTAHPDLAAYFRQKAEEEQNHDRWAIADLERLPDEVKVGLSPADAIQQIVAKQGEWISDNPLLFAAYMQWAEYFSVYIGDAWLDALAINGYGRDQVTAIAKHLGPDQDHAETGFRELEKFVPDEATAAAMLGVINESGRIFAGLLVEMAEC